MVIDVGNVARIRRYNVCSVTERKQKTTEVGRFSNTSGISVFLPKSTDIGIVDRVEDGISLDILRIYGTFRSLYQP